MPTHLDMPHRYVFQIASRCHDYELLKKKKKSHEYGKCFALAVKLVITNSHEFCECCYT